MLEPRRLAARGAFMARLREEVGGTVGYRVRESRVSARTRIEVVTEGVLTRMLRDDATLDGVSAVLFDEFHERSLYADQPGMTLETQQHLRPSCGFSSCRRRSMVAQSRLLGPSVPCRSCATRSRLSGRHAASAARAGRSTRAATTGRRRRW
jgi:hypothetical protein